MDKELQPSPGQAIGSTEPDRNGRLVKVFRNLGFRKHDTKVPHSNSATKVGLVQDHEDGGLVENDGDIQSLYSPLYGGSNAIRLMTLHAGRLPEKIRISLQAWQSLSANMPSYEALSYAWGPEDDPLPVVVNGIRLSVRQNLAYALDHLRLPDVDRTMWIDVICIDQSNLAERSHQVQLMGDVFRNASRVVIWLGLEADNSEAALNALSVLGSKHVAYSSDYKLLVDKKAFAKVLLDLSLFEGIQSILNRPWFSRLWIWQEITLARMGALLCGKDEIGWNHFTLALNAINSVQGQPQLAIPKQLLIAKQIKYLLRDNEGQYLQGLIYRTANCLCADPRDRIYAILSLAVDGLDIVPNYSIAVGDVYQDVVLKNIYKYKALDMLDFCELARVPVRWPSWVPDWSRPYLGAFGATGYDTCGRSAAEVKCIESRELQAIGMVFDEVIKFGEPVTYTMGVTESIDVIRKWTPKDILTASYVGGGSLLDAFCCALVEHNVRDRRRSTRLSSLDELRTFWLRVFHTSSHDDEHKSERYSISQLDHKNLKRYIVEKTLCVTSKGYIGLASQSLQCGDRVCILLGYKNLILLRPDGSGKNQVVGHCKLQGLSDAEGLLGPMLEYLSTEYGKDQYGRYCKTFVNTETGERTEEDPRLGALSEGWIEERSKDGKRVWRNRALQMQTTHDPRLRSGELIKRGLKMETFSII